MKKILFALLILALGSLSLTHQPAPKRPNIVMVIADDLSPTLGCYGDSVAPTPTIDRLARQGVLFEQAFCAAPSCSPSRAAILTGQHPHQLAEGTNLWGTLPSRYANVVNLLEAANYRVGLQGKGWGPGKFEPGGYTRNPAGPKKGTFEEFLAQQPASEQPFFFWIGPSDPHRPYDTNLKKTIGLRPQYLKVPAFLPDAPEVREDLLDYYAEAANVEKRVAEVMEALTKAGQAENTVVVITSDNGMPFPRAKANLYDVGTRIPLIIYDPRTASGKTGFAGGRRVAAPVSLVDLAPTWLELAGLPKNSEMVGQSLSRFNTGRAVPPQPVFVERERHGQSRAGDLGYPARGIRTADFLYIQNLKSDRWPGGDPQNEKATRAYGDIDEGLAKTYLLSHQQQHQVLADGAFAKRPAEELYDLRQDPNQYSNVASKKEYLAVREQLKKQLAAWQTQTKDPRLTPDGERIDTYLYYGERAQKH
jgi:N-sulfoglucosamine sulfohydrolase